MVELNSPPTPWGTCRRLPGARRNGIASSPNGQRAGAESQKYGGLSNTKQEHRKLPLPEYTEVGHQLRSEREKTLE
jgi:hypothetical protein